MLYTKESAAANIRNRQGKRVLYLGADDRLTAEAKDYLNKEGIAILSASQAKPERYALLQGGYLEEKPEHMTHLNGEFLVTKTHPRIAFRGAMDTLEAELLLCQPDAPDTIRLALEEILEAARELVRCDVLQTPVTKTTLCGLTPQQLREHSHRPQDFYGQPHFMPRYTDGKLLLQINRTRCAARAAELAAVAAFADREGNPTRVDLLQALNRMSSMLYLLMIRIKSGALSGSSHCYVRKE